MIYTTCGVSFSHDAQPGWAAVPYLWTHLPSKESGRRVVYVPRQEQAYKLLCGWNAAGNGGWLFRPERL